MFINCSLCLIFLSRSTGRKKLKAWMITFKVTSFMLLFFFILISVFINCSLCLIFLSRSTGGKVENLDDNVQGYLPYVVVLLLLPLSLLLWLLQAFLCAVSFLFCYTDFLQVLKIQRQCYHISDISKIY